MYSKVIEMKIESAIRRNPKLNRAGFTEDQIEAIIFAIIEAISIYEDEKETENRAVL